MRIRSTSRSERPEILPHTSVDRDARELANTASTASAASLRKNQKLIFTADLQKVAVIKKPHHQETENSYLLNKKNMNFSKPVNSALVVYREVEVDAHSVTNKDTRLEEPCKCQRQVETT